MTPDDAAFRDAVLARVCPVCGKGPFSMLASHTVQKHGLTAWELRDRAGLIASTSITSDELREQRTAQGKKNFDEHGIPRQGVGYRFRRTQAGNKVQREKAAAILADPEANEKRIAGISRALTAKAESDPEYRSRLVAQGKRIAKENRKRRSCVICGRSFWRTPETRDRSTCSDVCLAAARRKGLRVGWASGKGQNNAMSATNRARRESGDP